jgi:signal transduction histidine kinase
VRPSRLVRALSRLRPRRVRLRLTLLYGGLFVIAGAVLLSILYLLVSHSPKSSFVTYRQGPIVTGTPQPSGPVRTTPPPPIADTGAKEQAERQHEAELHHLLVESAIALAIMVLISIVLGWLMAGRILRPLRTMTDTVRQISARNVHERLAADGPRDELKDLSDTVDGLLERLETAMEAHKRFVANAAHELRTPLTVEHALLEETLIDRNATVDSYRATFEQLLGIRQHQARLLESLLTLTGSERGLDHSEPVDLSAVAKHVLAGCRAQIDRRGLDVGARIEPARTSGDPALVERLVANLFDNAADYNVDGGTVEISTGTEDGRAVVRVANTGPVIPAGQVDRLFEPFQRLDRTAGPAGHHGLGLSIVRAIAAAHDARLTASANPAGGLDVRVSFPAPAEPGHRGSSLLDGASAGAPAHEGRGRDGSP